MLVVRSLLVLVLGTAISPMLPPVLAAAAGETYVCWIAAGTDGPGTSASVIRCRIAGSEIRDFRPENPPPVVLLPAVGTDETGGCWYRRSWWSGWSLVTRYPDGSARLRYDPDGVPGGPVLADAVLPGCRSEPSEAPPDIEFAWRLLKSMRLGPSRIGVVPERPVSGLLTYFWVDLVSSHRGVLVSPVTGHRIEVRAGAGDIVVDWGDGSAPSRHRATDPALAAPRPDSVLTHVYERSGPAQVTVGIEWNARWRVDLGPWVVLPMEPLTAIAPLEVDQIVSRLVGPTPRR